MAPATGSNAGWTLLEFMAVVAVVGVLAAIAFGAVSGMADRARTATCASNLRQISTATNLHAAETEGRLPITGSPPFASPPWYNPLTIYLDTRMSPGSVIGLDPARAHVNRIFQCPAYKGPPARDVSYAPSVTWANLRLSQVPVPSRKIWIVTSTDSYSVNPSGLQRFNFPHPNDNAHALYFDGRVEPLSREELQALGPFPFNLSTQ